MRLTVIFLIMLALGGSHLAVAASAKTDHLPVHTAVWQWSVPMGQGRAFLWIPPECKQVRGVVVGQNNMIEQDILEHPIFRETLTKQGMAEVIQNYRAKQTGKRPQLLSVTSDNMTPAQGCGEPVTLPFVPDADGCHVLCG